MLYKVTVRIIGMHKTSIEKWTYNIRATSPQNAKSIALRIAKDLSLEKFSRYKNCRFEVLDSDVVLLNK